MSEYFPIYLQYQNSPKLINLVNKSANAMLFQNINFTNDYLDILTASTSGLDNWGIILNQPRGVISGNSYDNVFGFDDGIIPTDTVTYPQNFYHSNFYNINYSPTISLNNTQYRALLLLIYRSYTTNNSIYDMNNIIQQYATLTSASGVPVVYSNYNMEITYQFNYTLQNYERFLFQNPRGGTILPQPVGVAINYIF